MLFHIDADEGSQIIGWIMPDNPSIEPTVIVVLPDGKELTVPATIAKPEIVATLQTEFGFYHTTGVIGFVVDQTIVPNLAEIQEIELLDGQSRILLYRRFQITRHVQKKLCYFDVSLMPQRRILQNLSGRFTLVYHYAQRFPMETMLMLINNQGAKSELITGRPNFSRQIGLLRNAEFILAALLRDPYEELAERLIFVDLLAKSKASHLLSQFVSDVPALVDFARELPFGDPKALTAKFRTATPEQREAIMSPMTRVFGCGIGEIPEHRHVSAALDNLGTMNVVGTRARFADFRAILANILEVDVIGEAEIEMFDKVKELRNTLAQIGIVSDLLESDLTLYSYASEAIKAGLDGI